MLFEIRTILYCLIIILQNCSEAHVEKNLGCLRVNIVSPNGKINSTEKKNPCLSHSTRTWIILRYNNS